MGDILVEPLSLLVLDTTSAPPSRHRYRPGRPVPSAEHDNVVPDVPPTLSRGGCGACGGGETPCHRHVSPRNPIRFETTVDTPSPAAASPHAAPKSGRPQSGRHHVRASVDTTRTLIQSHPPDGFSPRTKVGTSFSGGRAAGIRRVGRQSPPPAPPHPRPHSPPAGPTARHRLRLR